MISSDFRHRHFESLDSTNAEARRLTEKGEVVEGALWITARQQTAGRGRRGRDWVSKPGNLFATLLLTLPVKPAIAAQVSFVTALALFDTCVSLLPTSANLSLKWPNDLLLEEKKLAGILLETMPCLEPEKTTLAIGCGVNLHYAPDQTIYPAICLNTGTRQPVGPQTFLARLAPSLDHRLAEWGNGKHFDLIAKAWQERASHIGKTISLIAADETFTGKFLSLAEDGALILEMTDGRQQHFHAGDVSLRPQTHEMES